VDGGVTVEYIDKKGKASLRMVLFYPNRIRDYLPRRKRKKRTGHFIGRKSCRKKKRVEKGGEGLLHLMG